MSLVFLVSREPRMRYAVTDYLRDRGYDTATAANYDEAMEWLQQTTPSAMVVDVQGIPRGEQGTSFLQFSQWLQSSLNGKKPPVVYLLHKGARRPNFRVEGTVIKKPFAIEALGETLRAQLGYQRGESGAPGIDLDLATNTVRSARGEVRLTTIEATLLAYLMEHSGEILNPRDLLVDVWQYHDSAGANTLVRAHVSNLRRKLREALGTAEQIQTIRGKGYRFSA